MSQSPDTRGHRHQTTRKAVVLLSGGADSATVLAIATRDGYAVYALTFDYGQRHSFEIDAARRLAEQFEAAGHVIAKIDLRVFGGSALTADIAVPKDRDPAAAAGGIPVTYVPARNTIFLSFALAWCEVIGAEDTFIGANAIDYSGYPDCRPAYLEAFERMANLATRTGIEGTARFRVHAPLLHMTKAEILRTGTELGVDYRRTHSCYDPTPAGLACGRCDSCLLRRRGFAEAGLPDPTAYA